IPIAGTPFTLHYSSARVPGNKAAKTVQIPLFDENVPKDVKRADVFIKVAGKEYKQSFTPKANTWTTFEWDGQDAYQRKLKGTQKAKVTVSYIYDAVYYKPSEFIRAFGQLSGVPISSEVRSEIGLSQSWDVNIAGDELTSNAVAGWNLDIHHNYDPRAGILYYGNGEKRSAQTIDRVIKTIAKFDQAISDFVIAGDGSIYLTNFTANTIYKIDPDGNLTQIAGIKKTTGFSGDGGPAINAELNCPNKITIGPDNSIYFSDYHNYRIRRIDQNGIITTVAGNGVHGYTGDGGPATAASIGNVQAIAVAPDGSIYLYSDLFNCLRRIGPDGIIETIAQASLTYSSGFPGDGRPLSETRLGSIKAMTFGKDGSLYIATSYEIWKVTPNGLLYHIGGSRQGSREDGAYAKTSVIGSYGGTDIAVDSVGNVYFTKREAHNIRVIDTEGIIKTIAGGGDGTDNALAAKAKLHYPTKINVDFDDNVYLIDRSGQELRKIYRPLPGFNNNEIFIASEDGSQLYHFNKNGKHLET
ncbi:MAG TPA: hypothetical protein PL158_14125, partial [Bacillota bacterium]|nr:hypothetical protein [Bacillota bacterium]